jgi:hypothetical protein
MTRQALPFGFKGYRYVVFKSCQVIYWVIGQDFVVFVIADGRRNMQSLLSRRFWGFTPVAHVLDCEPQRVRAQPGPPVRRTPTSERRALDDAVQGSRDVFARVIPISLTKSIQIRYSHLVSHSK